MKLIQKLWFFPLFILLIGTISALQVCQTYDDFSSGVLDESKWNEIGNIDEHFVNFTTAIIPEGNWVYHTAQYNASDREIRLISARNFLPGEIIEYDVNYAGGNGNRIHQITLDGKDYSLFGFWNSISDGGVGNDFGTYHIKLTFTNNGVSDEITLPNGSKVFTVPDGNLPSPNLQHTSVGIITRTGNNGVVYMDYDNFVICSEQAIPQNDLETRIVALEEKVVELENKNNEIDNRVSALESSLSNIQQSFNDFIKKIENFIKKLPKGLKKHWN